MEQTELEIRSFILLTFVHTVVYFMVIKMNPIKYLKRFNTAREENNNSTNLIGQIKFLILFQVIFGVNRIYLLQSSRLLTLISYLISFFYILISIYCIIFNPFDILYHMFVTEYLILVFLALSSGRLKMEKIFFNLSSYDELLNLESDLDVTSSKLTLIITASLSLTFNIIYFLIILDSNLISLDLANIFMFITITVHDFELIFFTFLQRLVFARLVMLTCHVENVFATKRKNNDFVITKTLKKLEKIAKKASLDIVSIRHAYELLQKSSEHLNYAMSLPVSKYNINKSILFSSVIF